MIWAEVLNRTQDKMDLYFVDAKSGKSRIVLTESTPGAWIDFEHVEVRFLNSSGGFLWPSWRDGNMHLYLYSFDKQNPLAADAKLERQLTQGDYEVLGIEGVDESAGAVFFSANKGDPRQRHIFSVKLDGTGLQQLTHDKGLYSAQFSEDGKHYEQTFSGPLTAPRMSLCAVGDAHALPCGGHVMSLRSMDCGRRSSWSLKRTTARHSTDVCCCLRKRRPAARFR